MIGGAKTIVINTWSQHAPVAPLWLINEIILNIIIGMLAIVVSFKFFQ